MQNPLDETLMNWGAVEQKASFYDIEKMYYKDHYSDFIKGQNARNEKNRHSEKNRTTEELLKNKITCLEEKTFHIRKEGGAEEDTFWLARQGKDGHNSWIFVFFD